MMASATMDRAARLPSQLRPYFWDYDFHRLRWETDSDLIIARVMERGGLDAMRDRAGDTALRQWLAARSGRGIGSHRLRYWELVLDVPHRQVTAWIEAQQDLPWSRRLGA